MVAVGVIGHRVLAELDKVEAGVEVALGRIELAFPGEPLTAVSALAEGADRIVAGHILARPGGRLVAVLPLPQGEIVADFRTVESKAQFLALLDRADVVMHLPPAAPRAAAYRAAGLTILDRSDVLVAVWDGRPAQRRAGTGAIVQTARRRGLPLAWVHAGNRRPGTHDPTSLGAEQGTVSFEDSLWSRLSPASR
jgi:hypothetical protein